LLVVAALVVALAVVVGVVVAARIADRPAPGARHATRAAATRSSPVAAARHGDPQPVPILMYHHVARGRAGAPLLWVRRAQLRGELAYLRDHGYHAVTMQQVYDRWTQGRALPARPVVLSFDDGYLDQYRYAAPLLRHYGDPGVLNLIVRNLGRTLTIAMVARMAGWGWEIDSHTITHRDVTLLPPATAAYELKGSRDLLQRYFHVPVNFFCYPGGSYDKAVEAAVRRAGYLAATSVWFGLARPRDLYGLPRIVVFGGEPLAVFAAGLEGSRRAEADADRVESRSGSGA
jgi:peptidoglycan/xylan/chitin deacetylase (PgdA/CDA1 family)